MSALLISLIMVSGAIAAPRAVVADPVFDFGSIFHGTKVDHVFVLKNTGDSPLDVGKVSTSCGCTVVDVSDRNIKPGNNAEIRATFNSTNFSGSVSKQIMVQTNDPKTPVYTLVMKGTVVEEIEASPKQLNLGEINAGKTKTVSIVIENKGKTEVKLTSINSTLPQVSANIDKIKLKPGKRATITVKLSPRKDDRFIGGYLNIKTTNPSKPNINIPIYASVAK